MPSLAGKSAIFVVVAIMIFTSPAPRVEAHGKGELPPDWYIIRGGPPTLPSTGSFINYEIPHVHPLDINPAGTRIAACNTPDSMVEIYSVDGSGNLTHLNSIRVGYAPVSARFRTDTELWVVNHISDSISIVDITTSPGKVIDTIHTYDGYDGTHAGDEPADVVFVTGDVALVSGSRSDTIQRYIASLRLYLDEFRLEGEDPRMLAVNAAGTSAYAAIFESGNSSTSINRFLVNFGAGPYSGANPPFNNGIPGTAWVAGGTSVVPADFTISAPPSVSLILKKDFADNSWKDDNGAIWTGFITGGVTGRVLGWDLLDNDVARLTSGDGFMSATYATRQMNIVMAVAVNPSTGEVFSVGIDHTNEIRFEPNLTGTFTRVMLSITNVAGTVQEHLVDLNEDHLDFAQGGGVAYEDGTVSQGDRDNSIGDPRGIAFKPSSTTAYISGMGSNNVVAVDTGSGSRLGTNGDYTIEVGVGPTGIVHHPTVNRLYVLNKFDASMTVIDTTTPGSDSVVQTLPFYDPTPDFLNEGRVHQYSTHDTSGLGQIACASCHIDSRMDRLAWDLGNPAGGTPQGVEKFVNTADLMTGNANVHNFLGTSGETDQNGSAFHSMKGPMTTQTLQDIIRHEPLHWRGDKDGIEQFSGAFAGLQGADGPLDAFAMQEYENFLSTIHFPPNPFRALDNSLPGGPQIVGGGTNPLLPLTGYLSPGDVGLKADTFSEAGTPMVDGNAWQGFDDYVDSFLDAGAINCVTCHALPMGSGSVTTLGGTPIPLGPNGQSHLGMVSNDSTGEEPRMKVAQLRNQMDKEGLFLLESSVSRAGFGTVHNGVGSGIARFLGGAIFNTFTDQDLADIVAFTLSINGGGFEDDGSFGDLFALSGGPSGTSPDGGTQQTAHAAVGQQVLITSSTPGTADQDRIDLFVTLANNNLIGLIATGIEGGSPRGWYHVSGAGAGALFRPDDGGGDETLTTVQNNASVSNPLTFMAVPTPSDERMGVDRDEDAVFNAVEVAQNTDPGNAKDVLYAQHDFGGTATGKPDAPFTSAIALFAELSPTPGLTSIAIFQAGNYNQQLTLTTPGTVIAVGGTVVIGAP